MILALFFLFSFLPSLFGWSVERGVEGGGGEIAVPGGRLPPQALFPQPTLRPTKLSGSRRRSRPRPPPLPHPLALGSGNSTRPITQRVLKVPHRTGTERFGSRGDKGAEEMCPAERMVFGGGGGSPDRRSEKGGDRPR
ncbi:MAG: hypothetical protein BJ554DRAFT_308 [Olpidium bornovanus]|uniref:Secreted protein n=1 Tax=Olpidium bornovanus TaxID=278681 RepID=A0A8H7ZUD2_9FUNG|nr:MAG: hypothetical protein BJ554DRAFT_308 [Olpidium bornovanus]